MMKKPIKRHIFPVIIYYKLVTGVIEFVFGLSFLFFGRTISKIYVNYRLKELVDDPHDLFIFLIQKVVPVLAHYHVYLMVTFIVFGLVKTVGAIALFYDKDWGLDLFILFFFLMLPFDIYTLFSHLTLLKTLYFLINTLITLYLVEFKPHHRLLKYLDRLKRDTYII